MMEEGVVMDQTARRGFTLIETVVAIGVFSIFFAAIAYILQQVLENVGISRVRTVALALGQERMELVRNLPFDDVGTIGGIPNGPMLQTENVTVNNTPFTVTTSIFYVDDPFDGIAPTDAIPADYKRVRIQVTWDGVFPSRQPVALVTNIVPKGIESNPGGGTLMLQVLNAQGLPVPSATVTVTNTILNPPININTLTNANGYVAIPAAPACISCYNISVTKSGHSQERTYTTTEVANPLLPPATVLEGQVTQLSFAIDQVSSLTIRSVGGQSAGYPPVAGVIFQLRGSKIIGYDTSDNPVYKYTYSTNTGGGSVGIPNLEWDNYVVNLTDSNYTTSGSNPLSPVALSPASTQIVTMSVEIKYNTSLLVVVKDAGGQLLPGVLTTLQNSGLGINLSKNTAATGAADFGQAFFNNLTPSSNYLLTASISGYQEATTSVNIVNNQQTTVVLTQ